MHEPGALVLILAEDDADLRALVSRALRREGYTVFEAADGEELLLLATGLEQAPDLVVSDVQMPLLSGPKALARLRAAGLKCPIILITAFGGEEARAAAQQLGRCVVLDKPLDLGELKAAVQERLEG